MGSYNYLDKAEKIEYKTGWLKPFIDTKRLSVETFAFLYFRVEYLLFLALALKYRRQPRQSALKRKEI